MTIADIKKTAEAKMGQSIEALKNNLARVRTGRANPSLLDSSMWSTTAPWCRCPRWPT
jgi:ribosome recycling factor